MFSKIMLTASIAALAFSLSSNNANSQARPQKKEISFLKLCTGGKSGNYKKAGDVLSVISGQADYPVAIEVMITEGSPDNLRRMNLPANDTDHCDGAYVQNDVMIGYKKNYPDLIAGLVRAGVLYNEWVHLICNKKSGINHIMDLSEKHTIAIGKPSQGHNVTWQGFKNASAQGWFSSSRRYDKVKTDEREMGYPIITEVNEGNGSDCFLYVGAFGTKFISVDAAANEFSNLVMVAANDKDMKSVKDNKGNPVYSFATIPSDQYKNLMPSGMVWGSNSVETIGVSAIFVLSGDWVKANKDGHESILRAFVKSKSEIEGLVKSK